MPTTDNSSPMLDRFETALLAELRQAVLDRRVPSRRRTRMMALGGVAASAAAAVGVGVVIGGSTPAFAVEHDSDGDVTVTINRLEDATGLEQALADNGVTADVRYQGSTLESDPAGLFDPASLPEGAHRYTDDECRLMVGQQVAVDPDGRFHVLIPQAALQTGDPLTLLVSGTSPEDADMLLAVGNRASGCSSQTTKRDEAWARWSY
jgi:hypothetical protein